VLRAQSFAQLRQDARSRGERVPDRPLAKLDHVAEEDEAVDIAQRLAQAPASVGVLQAIATTPRAQMQIGDD
jgi:hypothetical protein